MKLFVPAAVLLTAFTIAGWVRLAQAGDFVVSTEHGNINWAAHYIEASGTGVPAADSPNTPRSREQTFVNARRQAYQNLLKTVLTLPLTSEATVRDYVANKDEVLSKIEQLLNTAHTETTRYLTDGTVEIAKQMPITGAFSQLILPETVIQLEMKKMGKETNGEAKSAYTGLVIDARELPVKPTLCFKLFDEEGQEVYGPAYASRDSAVQRGMCTYRTEIADIATCRRVGDNPLIVRGLKMEESGGNIIVISNTDASLLRSAVDHLFFMRKCNVMVIVDPALSKSPENR